MRTYLISFRGKAPFTVDALNRTAARQYALRISGFTPNGPAPRGLTIASL